MLGTTKHFLRREPRIATYHSTAIPPQQDSLGSNPSIHVAEQLEKRMKTEGLPAADLVQVGHISEKAKIIGRDRHHPRKALKTHCQIQPNAVTEHRCSDGDL
jgi:hypothetical protein